MNRLSRYVLVAGVAAAGLCPLAAYAQEAPDTEIEEVVVSARRKAENIQNVPIAITAFTQTQLQNNNIVSVVDLQTQVPSLSTNSYAHDTAQVSIRGQGGYSPGGSPSVTAYMNEVPADVLGLGSYYDLASLEVLKGPQGTLFGRNSTGGAIVTVSKRPTNEFGGYLEGTLGNYDDREYSAALNVPIVDGKLLFRLAGTGQIRDGYTILQGTTLRPNVRIDLDDRKYNALRATLRFTPSERITNDLIIDHFLQTSNGTSNILSAVNPRGPAQLFFPTLSQQLAQQQALGVRREITSLVDRPFFKLASEGVTDILSIQLTDNITFRNIAGYRRAELNYQKNPVGGTLPILTFPTEALHPQVTKQLTEEMQLQGKSFDGKLDWVVGGFYQHNPLPPLYETRRVTLGSVTYTGTHAAEKSRALYGQATMDLSALLEGLKFTAGYRYTWDYRFLSTRSLTNGLCVSAGADATCTLKGSAKFKAPTWTVGLDYRMSPDLMVYVASRRGYRSGGFNSFASAKADQSFGPEYVTDLEFGLKSNFHVLDMRAQANLAAYRQWYKDVQLPDSVFRDGRSVSLTLNGGAAVLNGVEFEGTLAPTHDLKLFLNLAYGDARFTKFDSTAGAALNRTFNWTNLPRYKATLGATYTLPVDPSWGVISLSGNFTWQQHYYVAAAKDPFDSTPDVGLLNLSANWDNVLGKPFDASFFMSNVTDRTYIIGGFSIYNTLGISSPVYSEPRMFGVRLRYRFGAEGS
jgi:iron complex outermembrane receptor protein